MTHGRFIRSMNTEAINHEPAITVHYGPRRATGQVTGRPCCHLGHDGRAYGLGSSLVLQESCRPSSSSSARPHEYLEQVQAISARLWSAGYLSGEHAGVSAFRYPATRFCSSKSSGRLPLGVRCDTLDGLLKALNEMAARSVGDPETQTRIAQFEMTLFLRLQSSVPELTDLLEEGPGGDHESLRPPPSRNPGTFMRNSVLMARRA